MLFGDYRVQVWRDDLTSALDREYFCRGYDSADKTALEIRNISPEFSKLSIWIRELDDLWEVFDLDVSTKDIDDSNFSIKE